MNIAGILIGITLFVLFLYFPKLLKTKENEPEKDEPKNLNQLDPNKVFESFIGNDGPINQLKRLIRYAQKNKKYVLPPIGLFGPKSVGKTEVSKLIAKCLGLPIVALNKTSLSSEENLLEKIQNYIIEDTTKEFLLFIDEVHLLPRKIQDSLLTSLEENDRLLRTHEKDIDTSNITFVVATTEPNKLSSAFLSRLTALTLEPYDEQQIVEILKKKTNTKNIPDESLYFIAKASKCIPRKAIAMINDVTRAVELGDLAPTATAICADLQANYGCDSLGLTRADRRYMVCLSESSEPLSLASLADKLELEQDEIQGTIEPHLVKLSFIRRFSKGRELTQKGEAYLKSLS